ncbi:Very short patch repair protein [Gimesia maris]|uniref:very short patch repair endonuclease n=1 Tax=Gimesia maris TaxID=122 RepID=UPI001188FAB9|nr:Very short patch repair protein [Gimesia maris]
MADRISPEHRSWNMSRIKNRDTKPELIVRSLLYRMGYRFRLHRKDLPGKPDIVLPKYKTVIFVHGCFWHRHKGCKYAYNPKSRVNFWKRKFADTIERDKRQQQSLRKSGWNIIVIWECECMDLELLSNKLQRVDKNL